MPTVPPGFVTRVSILLGLALVLAVIAFIVPTLPVRLGFLAAAVALLLLSLPLLGLSLWRGVSEGRIDGTLQAVHGNDPSPVLLTDPAGVLVWCNAQASKALGLGQGGGVVSALSSSAAMPDALIARLLSAARDHGRAEQRVDVEGRAHDLHVDRVGPDRLLWRFHPGPGLDADGREDGPLQIRIDAGGSIVWISPRLLERLDHPPAHVDGLVERPPLKLNAAQTLKCDDQALRCWVTGRAVGDDLREISFQPVPQEREDTQFDTLPVPLLEIEEDGTVAKANRLARQLLSLETGETVALHNLFEGLGRQVGDWLGDAFDGRARGRPEVMRASRAENDLFIQVTLEQVGEGPDTRMMAVLHDATEMKRLEAQFVQSQKMQAIGQLAGGVAHDFNNLLTAISGHCDLLLLRHDPGDQDFADLEQINQNANRAAALVGQLLAFSRKQNLRPEILDLRDILSDLTHLLNRLVGERVRLSFSHGPDLRMVRVDRRQLEQVIVNLVVNARDAMPKGGDVKVITRTLTLETPEAHDRVEVPAGRYALIEVVDQGTGIPESTITKIFEPFFTTKKTGEGTGLGLSTAYGIVKQTGGYIFARSELGKGTTFSIYLPISDHAAIALAPVDKAKEIQKPQAEGRILLVEDEAPVRAFATRALRMRGHEVLEAEDAEAALAICSDASVEIDVFVTDVIMPGRDGPSWVREALETRPDTRVIFVSGYAEESFTEAQAAIPNSTFLPKPFSLRDLTATVEAQLKAPSRPD